MEPLLTLIGAGLCLAVPVAVIVLWNRLSALEAQVRKLSEASPRDRPPLPSPAAGVPAATSSTTYPTVAAATPAPAVVAPIETRVATPPPLPIPPPPPARNVPATPVAAPAGAAPVIATDPWAGLRRLGLLPPADLKGEFALGSWWAIRVAGALALASIVFLAVWLNLRSTLPPWLRLAEIVALGGLGAWGGLHLERSRRDLGRVVFAVGLAVFQFSAWAAHGLERMRVLETPGQAAALQFFVAFAVGAVALTRRDRLIGQLSIGFAAIAAGFSIDAGSDPLSIGWEAGSIATLGGVLLARGGWTSAAALSLLASTGVLTWLRLERPDAPAVELAGQLGATLIFLSLWLADRFGPTAEAAEARIRNALLGAAFLLPATLAVWIAREGDDPHALAAGLAALAALAIGCIEWRRRRLAAEILLASALFFLAASAAWKLAPDLVWLAWMLAAALAQLLRERAQVDLLSRASKLLTIVGTIAFLREPPTDTWACLLAPAAAGALTAWRVRTDDQESELGRMGLLLELACLALLTGFVQSHLDTTRQPWAWLVVVPSALLFRRPVVLWALAPAVLWTHFTVLLSPPTGPLASERGWMLAWALALVAANTSLVRLSERRESLSAELLRPLLSFITAALLLKALDLALGLPVDTWRAPLLWSIGALLTCGLAEGLRRLTSCPLSPLAAILAFWPTFLLAQTEASGPVTASDLAPTPLWLLGQTFALLGFARFRRAETTNGPLPSGLYATLIGGTVFVAFARLDGGTAPLFWAFSAATTYALGKLRGVRAYETVGTIGLLGATVLALTTGSTSQPYVYLALALLDAAMVWQLEAWDDPLGRVAQHAFAILAPAFALIAVGKLLPSQLGAYLPATLWLAGAAIGAATAEAFVRSTHRRSLGLVASLTLLPAFLWIAAPKAITLAATPLWLAGLGLSLFALARHSLGTGRSGTIWRSLFGAGCGLIVLTAFDALSGAQVSLSWALASALTFALGLSLGTRAYRMLGLTGLLLATGHVILFDVHDLIGRIIACAAIAAAFFAVAWLYGRFVKKDAA